MLCDYLLKAKGVRLTKASEGEKLLAEPRKKKKRKGSCRISGSVYFFFRGKINQTAEVRDRGKVSALKTNKKNQ